MARCWRAPGPGRRVRLILPGRMSDRRRRGAGDVLTQQRVRRWLVRNVLRNIGYTLVGSPTLTCQADATWTGSPPTARAVAVPLVPGGGTVVEGDTRSHVVQIPVVLSQPTEVTVTADWVTLLARCAAHCSRTRRRLPSRERVSELCTGHHPSRDRTHRVRRHHQPSPTNGSLSASGTRPTCNDGWLLGLGFGVIRNDDV